jgi:BirA family biotin operon repressor/biotin-[acetyl-CoA-carboxylase] ligase
MAVSVLLRPVLPAGEPLGLEHYGWLPLIAGLSMTRAVASVLPGARVGLKWPNDVLVGGLKASGILTELLPGRNAVVVGAGVNLAMTAEQLPTTTSTSLSLAGATLVGDELADVVLVHYLGSLRELYGDFVRSGADAAALVDLLGDWCTTLGQQVRVELPGGDTIIGTATGIDGTGRLQVRRSSDGRSLAVAAGDVTHLRYE